MKKPTTIFLIVFIGILLALALAVSASVTSASPGGRRVGPRMLSMWAGPGVILDVAPYGLERWSPGLFVKVSVPVAKALALSVRPHFLYENRAFALRAAATLDLLPGRGKDKKPASRPTEATGVRTETCRVDLSLYLGGGFACHRYGTYLLNPIICGGVDIGFLKRFVFMRGDTDLELLGGVGIKIR